MLILCLSALLSVSSSALASEQVIAKPAILTFDDVMQGEPVNLQFELHNPSSHSRTVRFMDFSAPGLRAQVSPRIEADSNVQVVVSWDTSKLSGDVEGKITLLFDGSDAQIVVTIKGNVVHSAASQPD